MSFIDSSIRHDRGSSRKANPDSRPERAPRHRDDRDTREKTAPDAPIRERMPGERGLYPGERLRQRIVPGSSTMAPSASPVCKPLPSAEADLRTIEATPPSQFALAGRGRHVVILVENLPVPFDRRPWQIAQTLQHQGFHVSIVCPQMYEYTQKFERLSEIDIYRYPNYEASGACGYFCEYLNALLWMSWICLRLFLTQGIAAIHACNPPDLLFLVAWPFRVFFGVRFLFDHHDLGPEVYFAKFGRTDWLYHLMCAVERMTYRLADVALATNKSFKRIASQRCAKKSDRIFVVRNAPTPGRFNPGPPRRELRFGKAHLIAYLGVMNKQDGVDLLLESIQHVIQGHQRKDVVFGLIGDGPEVPQLKLRAKQLGLNGEVKFLGRISDGRTLSDYLNTATVCVCPDPRNPMNDHSTMTKVVEYMALGRPIVAYDLRETHYSAADAALYATDNNPRQFGDLIVQLLDDPSQRHAMGLCGKARYDVMLSWQRSQEQLIAAYTRLFDPRSNHKPANAPVR